MRKACASRNICAQLVTARRTSTEVAA